MGLFVELLALSDVEPLATGATSATLVQSTSMEVAESQESQLANTPEASLSRRVARVARVAEVPISANHELQRFAIANGIDWTAARSQMIEGDAEAGAAQLAADRGDGAEHASVACWLRLLADRASVDGLRGEGEPTHAHAAASTNQCSSAKQGMAKGRVM